MITFFILHFFSRWMLHECKTRKPNRLIHGSSHTSLDFLSFFSFLLLLFIFSYVCFFLLWSSPLCDFPFSRYSMEPIPPLPSPSIYHLSPLFKNYIFFLILNPIFSTKKNKHHYHLSPLFHNYFLFNFKPYFLNKKIFSCLKLFIPFHWLHITLPVDIFQR